MTGNNTTPISLLVAGCGDVGTALAEKLHANGLHVYGLKRTINQLPDCIQPITADLADPQQIPELPAVDYVVYCVAAKSREEQVYRNAYVTGVKNLLEKLPISPKHFFFTSSTAVYHQQDHQWVDENSECQPSKMNGQVMLEAEQQVLAFNSPSTVVRFSGIYGPGRTHLLKKVASGSVPNADNRAYTNRIHRDDCAGILYHLINRCQQGYEIEQLYLASDSKPTPLPEICQWLAKQLNITAQSGESLTRNAGSKRCSNQRILDSGYQFIYPEYRSGYQQLITEFSKQD